jgi:hypothetical protein
MRWPRSLCASRTLLPMILLGLAAVAWANLPYLTGYLVQSDDLTYSGFFIFEQDGFSYLAKMRQGAEGDWLFHLPYTTEPHQGVLLFVLYLVMGKAACLLHLPLAAAYHLTRLVGSGLLLAAGARFITSLAGTARWQLVSWALILFAGGAGWLISFVDPQYVAFASVTPDAFVYSVLYGPPHTIIALALLLWVIPGITPQLQAPSGPASRGRWLPLTAAVSLMSLARPEYMGVLLYVLGTYWLALCLSRRCMLFRSAAALAGITLPGTLYALYVLYISQANPAIAAWTAQNPFFTPPLSNLLVGIGPLMALSVLGVACGRWWEDEHLLLPAVWVANLPLLLYLPLSLNRRLIGGAQFPLALAAGYWVDQHMLPWLGRIRWRWALAGPAAVLLIIILVSYPVLFGLGAIGFVASRPGQLFLSSDERAGLEWLAQKRDRPVVLSAEQTGNRIPAFSSALPVLGHAIETLHVEEKRSDVARFYAAATPSADRQAILERYGVTHVWWGPSEQALGAFNPEVLPAFRLAFQSGAVQVWSGAQ